MAEKTYIKVILPLRLEWEPCYWSDRPLPPGRRIEVRFAGKIYTGVVSETLDAAPGIDPGRILEVCGYETGLEDILPGEIALWRWISEYYLCTVGEVYKNAYPALKLKGEQVSARAREREENMREKAAALKQRRLEATLEKLAAKQAALGTHRPGTKVALAIEDAVLRLTDQAATLQREIDSAAEETSAEVETPPFTAPVKSKPLLLSGPDRVPAYLTRIREEIANGRTTLMLVPEIERSCRLQDALEDEFGERVLVFHSELAAGKRRAVAAKLRSGGPYVVLGTRSALFLPLTRLGLVIIDEEQDHSYKQTDFAPRYNGRDTAIALASIAGANVLLGSSCPSLETVLNCRSGKYLLSGDAPSAEAPVEIIDTTEERRKRGMSGPLSFRLIREIGLALEKGSVAILAPQWALDEVGAKISELFPSQDGISVANLYTSKWLDTPGTKLVAVLSPDSMLSRQDIRADERALQTLELFRSKTGGGKFIVQTARSQHPVFSFESGRVERLLAERKEFGLPPYTRLVDIEVKDSNEGRKALMEKELAKALVGPWKKMQLPGRLRLILPKDRNLTAAKESIRLAVQTFEKDRKYPGRIHLDVDPA